MGRFQPMGTNLRGNRSPEKAKLSASPFQTGTFLIRHCQTDRKTRFQRGLGLGISNPGPKTAMVERTRKDSEHFQIKPNFPNGLHPQAPMASQVPIPHQALFAQTCWVAPVLPMAPQSHSSHKPPRKTRSPKSPSLWNHQEPWKPWAGSRTRSRRQILSSLWIHQEPWKPWNFLEPGGLWNLWDPWGSWDSWEPLEP